MDSEEDLTRILDTRKLYLAFLALNMAGLIIAIYLKNFKILTSVCLIIVLLLIFKKDLYLNYKIVYLKCQIHK